MTVEPPRTLADLLAVSDPVMRVKAARAYADQRQKAIAEALAIRDQAIRVLLNKHGPAEVARLCEVSLSTVKLARGRS